MPKAIEYQQVGFRVTELEVPAPPGVEGEPKLITILSFTEMDSAGVAMTIHNFPLNEEGKGKLIKMLQGEEIGEKVEVASGIPDDVLREGKPLGPRRHAPGSPHRR